MKQIKQTQETAFTKITAIAVMIIALMGASLPIVNVSGIGTLYLFRIAVPFLFLWMIVRRKRFERSSRDLLKMMIVWSVWGGVSLLWSFDRANSIQGIFSICFCFVWVLWVVSFVHTVNLYDNMLRAFVVFIVICCLLGIYEVFSGDYIFAVQSGVESVITSIGKHYPITVFYNPNDFMVFVAASMPMVFYLVSKNIANKCLIFIIDIGYVLFVCVMMLLADCRMGFAVVPSIVLVWLVSKKWNARFYKVVILGVIVGAVILIASPNVIDLIASEARWEIWTDALYNLKESFFLGTGIGNANFHLSGHVYKSKLTATHFWFLQVLTEIGVPGFFFVAKWYLGSVLKVKKATIAERKSSVFGIKRFTLTLLLPTFFLSMMSASLMESAAFWTLIAIMQVGTGLKIVDQEKAKNEG